MYTSILSFLTFFLLAFRRMFATVFTDVDPKVIANVSLAVLFGLLKVRTHYSKGNFLFQKDCKITKFFT